MPHCLAPHMNNQSLPKQTFSARRWAVARALAWICRCVCVCEKKHSSGEKDPWEGNCSEHQIRDWRAVSAARLQGKGSPKGSVFSQTQVSLPRSSRSGRALSSPSHELMLRSSSHGLEGCTLSNPVLIRSVPRLRV